MSNDFAIGGRLEDIPLGEQLLAQRLEVFDDSIVDQDHFAIAAGVRMCVLLSRWPMGGPTRVPNPHGADRSGCADTHHQLFNSTDSSAHGQTVWSQDGNPGTVITAVFQTPQAIDQKW